MKHPRNNFDGNVRCPNCNQKEFIGFLGGSSCKRYFCNDCCTEFQIKDNKIKIIELEDIKTGDGN